MSRHQQSVTQGVVRVQIVGKIVFQGQGFDAGIPVVICFQIHKKAIFITGAKQGQIREKPIRIKVVPSQGGGTVLPVDTG